MSNSCCCKIPSIAKKYLMALTGLILALFVLGHMVGNLQMFIGQDLMNEYAHKLQHLPYGLLWIVRGVLLMVVAIHVWMALSLTIENRRARPKEYEMVRTVQASLASKTMGVTGSILLFFIVFHILHFTTKTLYPEYFDLKTMLDGVEVADVYRMVLTGFSVTWVSVFYIFSMALLCMHLSHGFSSMFQSLGLRNSRHRGKLDKIAKIYGWVVFLGFSSTPACVLISKFTSIQIFPL